MDSRTLPADSPPPERNLPPVEPPSASFLLQLFLIPLVIVIVIVMVWLLFSWLAHMGTNPQDVARDIGRLNDASWQKAYNLAEMLRKPQYDKLKDDRELALELAATLDKLRTTRPDRHSEVQAARDEKRRAEASDRVANRLLLEEYLCKALGEFRVPDGLPALIAAAEPIDDPAAFGVRSAAIQSIAIMASQPHSQSLASNEKVMATLIAASQERGEGPDAPAYNGLRSTAAFALGMIGGDQAEERLYQMLDDGDVNTRYNAATGLARHGDVRALPVLGEMLDPENQEALSDPEAKDAKSLAAGQPWKRALVVTNGIRAARQLVAKNPTADYRQLADWLDRLQKSDVNERVKVDARELKLVLQQRDKAGAK